MSPDGVKLIVNQLHENLTTYRIFCEKFTLLHSVLAAVSSNELLKIELKTVPLLECNTTLLQYNKDRDHAAFRNGIDESQYCAHDPLGKKDSCQGDSGGPLQSIRTLSNPGKVVGIVSFGVGCGSGQPGIISIGLDQMFGQTEKLKHYK